MSINFNQARDFVYSTGILWERDLFAYLFQGGSPQALARLHHNLKGYQNADGGYGNALEHDVRCPQSHPLALEYLLTVLTQTGIPVGNLLDGVVSWVESNRKPDGSLSNPPELLEYPHAPWWNEGGQTMPDSITGNLIALGKSSPALNASTAQWVQQHLTLEQIRANDWLFMAYHAYDYYLNVPGDGQELKATVENIVHLAQTIPADQYYSLMRFAMTPDSPVAKAAPELIQKALDHLAADQQADGGWNDQHGLPQWRPYVTIANLLALRNHGRQIGG